MSHGDTGEILRALKEKRPERAKVEEKMAIY